MKRRSTLLGFFFASVGPTAKAGIMDWFTGIQLGMPVPDFDAEYLAGEPRSDSKLLLIDFWATWCGPCREEFPYINALSDAFSQSGLEVLGLTKEPKAVAMAFLPKVNIRYKIGVGGARPLQKLLGITALPYAIIANRQKKVIWRGQVSELKLLDVERMLKSAA